MSKTTGMSIELIQGASLQLRRTHPDDASLLYAEMYSNRDFMAAIRPNDNITGPNELAARITAQNAIPIRDARYLEYLIIHKTHGPIGWLAIADYEPLHSRAEYLFGFFRAEHRQARHVAEAALLSHELAFNTLGVHRLTAQVFTHNKIAQKSLINFGYSHEGTLREQLYSKLANAYLDVHYYGLTASQFRHNERLSKLSRVLLGRDATSPPRPTVTKVKPHAARPPAQRTVRKAAVRPRLLPMAVAAALSVSAPAWADNFSVTQGADNGDDTANGTLSWAIRQANQNAGSDSIVLENDVIIKSAMKNLIDSDVEIIGNNYTIYGNDPNVTGDAQYRPLFVKSGSVTLSDMTISGGKASGGWSRMGGGGAGLGGALFIYDGNVTTRNVTFSNNLAVGGNSNESVHAYGGGSMSAGPLTLGNAESHGGAGMFANSSGYNGAYGGNGNYGGYGGSYNTGKGGYGGDGGFGGGGGVGYHGGNGGFGGGGAYGPYGGAGGFGGGGGYGQYGGDGGFGGGGGAGDPALAAGTGGYGAGNGTINGSGGGGGAGMGGAIFVRSGTLKMINTSFDNNSAQGGDGANPGEGIGGALFLCTPSESSSCSASVSSDSCGVTFSNNIAENRQADAFGETGTATETCNTAPYATNVVASGNARVGATLSGSYVYTDDEGDPETGTSYRWYRTNDHTGSTNLQTINGATSESYTLNAEDLGKYIFFEVTPMTNVGITQGDPVMSAQAVGPVTEDDSSPDTSDSGSGGGGSSQFVWLAALLAMRFWRRRR